MSNSATCASMPLAPALAARSSRASVGHPAYIAMSARERTRSGWFSARCWATAPL